MEARARPAIKDDLAKGKVTLQNTLSSLSPKVRAACSSFSSTEQKHDFAACIIIGKEGKRGAKAAAGKEKRILDSLIKGI